MIDEETVKKVLDVLRDEVSEMPKNWNRRFKHNRDKIKTGDIYELAEVVRNLSLRESEKGLSTGEKQMFTRTKKILASELMYALDKDEEEAESYLDELLADSATSQLAARRPSSEALAHAAAPARQLARARQLRAMTVALIVAAGSGERLGAERPEGARRAGRPADARVERRRAARRRRRSSGSSSRCRRASPAPAGVIGVRGRRRRARSRCGGALAAAPARTSRCSCTTPRGRC